MNAPRTHYQVLGVAPDASYLEIKKAYRALAKDAHPDRITNPTEEDQLRFAQIAEAYRVLSHLRLRQEYDVSLNPPQAENPPPGSGFYRPHYTGYPYFQWDIFTPHLHAFFVGGASQSSREQNLQSLLFNYKTLTIAILGALYFFKFFISIEGTVVEKKIEERLFNNTSYFLLLKTDEEKPKKKRVKYELYDLVKAEDEISKPLFSMTFRVNDDEISGPSPTRFVMQVGMIYLVITGGLILLEKGRGRPDPVYESKPNE